MSEEFENFYASLKIKFLNSSPYYTQANGQWRVKQKLDEVNKAEDI
jgi:hypothetical protein